MFWEAMLRLSVVAIVLPVPVAAVWLLAYRLGSRLFPDWLTSGLARGIIWARHVDVTKVAAGVIAASSMVSLFLWPYLWGWTLLIGLVTAGALLLARLVH